YYDGAALDQAWQMVKGWNAGERQQLRDDVPRLALGAAIAGRSLRDVGRDALALARDGLKRRARRDAQGRDETIYLAPLERILETGRPLAQDRLDLYHGAWRESVAPAFTDCVINLQRGD
ncbi:MAG: glutamate--cysteine ligase, partial [Methylocystis sp.]|nr:glutamate--cysteine ligase [Methylocystis sp.]